MRFSQYAFVLVVLATLAACETSVDPILGTEKAFTLYGVLRPAADTQWVRVYPVEDRLAPAAPESLDVNVTSTELERGRTRAWRDSVIQEEDGRYAHVSWHPFRVAYERTYRLTVSDGEQQAAYVQVTVPPDAALVLQEPEAETAPVVVPVLVNNEVPRLINLEVEYYIQFDFEENVGPNDSPTAQVPLSYDGTQRAIDDGWIVPVDLTQDYKRLREMLQNADLWNPEVGIVLRDMTLRLEVANEEWDPPGGEFDPNVLVEPGAMSNVEDGFGFVGAGYRLKKQWVPSTDVLKKAGWTDPTELY